jgi:hypothetical protein
LLVAKLLVAGGCCCGFQFHEPGDWHEAKCAPKLELIAHWQLGGDSESELVAGLTFTATGNACQC